ncbi:MAG: NADH-quinone oxidoreductase subunit J [Desulfofustis sp.]|nr:NADH-quinone oxidoreductase subunit J [Desulfofustis sp.]MBT8355399.1 NADH-quinone oxidoreductase subunit J [Desulfofustis sp.]NNF47597.1 NADH-quinone oxidoreductase subunit J [Desulfofustis sp.]NNK56678.1 NADH-quinone oxidoreductase subunit J [Desulfofustis sp.]RZW18662.1 MAG: NADH-quinone oxidoreductase subunit J [Desulfobulbaceae bacterium]
MTPVPPPALFSADGMVGLIFLVMIGVTLFGGFIAATAERLVRALSGIVICFTGVAGFYYFLNSPFMAMMQILIYVGAICVTISFAIMLAAPEEKIKSSPSNMLSGPFGFMIAALIFGGMTALALTTEWQVNAKTASGSVREIGIHLLTTYSMIFELISIVLLIAIIGSIVIARGGRN